MAFKNCETYQVDIFVGSKHGYSDITNDELEIYYQQVKQICQEFCNKIGLGLTIQKVDFVYTQGAEPGVKIGLINYPRFPKSSMQILVLAFDLATTLRIYCKQERITVITPNRSYLLEDVDSHAKKTKKG